MKQVKYVVRRENNRCIIIIIDSSREEICTSIALFYPFTRECREILASIREIKPPLSPPLLSITMRKSLGEKVAWRGGKRLKSDEKSSGPVFESRKSKKKRERETETEAYGASVFSTRMRSRDFCPAASCRDGSRRMILDYFERACVSRAILADRFQTVFEASTDALPTDASTMILWK